MSDAVPKGRSIAALLIAGALVLSVPAANVLVELFPGDGASVPGQPIVQLGNTSAAENPLSVLDQMEASIDAVGGSVPGYFAEEVGLPDGRRDVRVDDTGRVVGCVVDGRADEVLSGIVGAMEERGWTAVPLGQASGATFVKEGGACTWVLTTCTQVGDSTSVVYRCATG